jgi:hypothetical protein
LKERFNLREAAADKPDKPIVSSFQDQRIGRLERTTVGQIQSVPFGSKSLTDERGNWVLPIQVAVALVSTYCSLESTTHLISILERSINPMQHPMLDGATKL